MNWTGGDLNRAAANRTNATQQKQKAYFARAKAGAQRQSSRDHDPHIILSSDSATHALPHHAAQHHPQNIDMVEYELLRKRQELLRRPDWLGLEITKPLRFHFASRVEKANFGRRRRLPDANSSARRVSEKQHSRSPIPRLAYDRHALSRHTLRLHDSTQQPTSSYHIKIGTGALDSGTPPVKPPQQTTQQRVLAELEDLSEEPMLLDSDDEVFESRYQQAQQRERELQHAACAPDLHQQVVMDRRPLFVPEMRAGKQISSQGRFSHKSAGSLDTTVLWSTSIIDRSSDVVPVEQWPAPQRSTSVVKDSQINRDHVFADLNKETERPAMHFPQPHAAAPRPIDYTHAPGNQNQTRYAPPAQEVHHKDVAVQVSSTLGHTTRQPKTARVDTAKPSARNAFAENEEEIWRRFILGDTRSASEDSVSRPPTRNVVTKDIGIGYLEPEHFTSETAKYSTAATQGVPKDQYDRASYIPDLSSTATMDKTTRAFLSSTPWR